MLSSAFAQVFVDCGMVAYIRTQPGLTDTEKREKVARLAQIASLARPFDLEADAEDLLLRQSTSLGGAEGGYIGEAQWETTAEDRLRR